MARIHTCTSSYNGCDYQTQTQLGKTFNVVLYSCTATTRSQVNIGELNSPFSNTTHQFSIPSVCAGLLLFSQTNICRSHQNKIEFRNEKQNWNRYPNLLNLFECRLILAIPFTTTWEIAFNAMIISTRYNSPRSDGYDGQSHWCCALSCTSDRCNFCSWLVIMNC